MNGGWWESCVEQQGFTQPVMIGGDGSMCTCEGASFLLRFSWRQRAVATIRQLPVWLHCVTTDPCVFSLSVKCYSQDIFCCIIDSVSDQLRRSRFFHLSSLIIRRSRSSNVFLSCHSHLSTVSTAWKLHCRFIYKNKTENVSHSDARVMQRKEKNSCKPSWTSHQVLLCVSGC